MQIFNSCLHSSFLYVITNSSTSKSGKPAVTHTLCTASKWQQKTGPGAGRPPERSLCSTTHLALANRLQGPLQGPSSVLCHLLSLDHSASLMYNSWRSSRHVTVHTISLCAGCRVPIRHVWTSFDAPCYGVQTVFRENVTAVPTVPLKTFLWAKILFFSVYLNFVCCFSCFCCFMVVSWFCGVLAEILMFPWIPHIYV